MTRHPTTQDMRRLLDAMRANTKPGTKPLSHRERAVLDDAELGRLQHGEQRESKPRVPIIGVNPGAIPGTRPDYLYGGGA